MIKIQVEKTKDGYLIPSTLGEDIELSETDFQKLCS